MSGYQLTPQALDDLFDIWSYIAGDDLDAANRVEEAIHIACAFLADAPLAGRIREDLTALPVRFWLVQPYRNHWIIYNPQEQASASHSDYSRGTEYSGGSAVEGRRSALLRVSQGRFVELFCRRRNGQLETGGFAGGTSRTKRVGTCWMSARVGFFFLGFFTSRRRASLFPMADSLPQVAKLG